MCRPKNKTDELLDVELESHLTYYDEPLVVTCSLKAKVEQCPNTSSIWKDWFDKIGVYHADVNNMKEDIDGQKIKVFNKTIVSNLEP